MKTKRFFELMQLFLGFLSVCAVVEASRTLLPPDAEAGYHASAPLRREAAADRAFRDLARLDRKRREAEQEANRRAIDSSQSTAALLGVV